MSKVRGSSSNSLYRMSQPTCSRHACVYSHVEKGTCVVIEPCHEKNLRFAHATTKKKRT